MRKTLIAAFAATTLAIVAGCGTTKDADTDMGMDSPMAGARHNSADATFAQMMIPHHEQAIEMAAMAESRTQNAEVRDLAAAIEGAQDPEIRKMKGWLRSWDEDMAMSEPMGHGMPGMMDEKTMTDMGKAQGAGFDFLFLNSMIAHHGGAIEMAKAEKADGKHPGARAMADAIIKGQSAEIAQMRGMLKD